jgi:hypothetical protein
MAIRQWRRSFERQKLSSPDARQLQLRRIRSSADKQAKQCRCLRRSRHNNTDVLIILTDVEALQIDDGFDAV